MAKVKSEESTARKPSLLDALIPVIFLVVSLAAAIYLYGDNSISGPVQVSLILTAAIAGLIGIKNGHSVASISKAAVDSISTAVGAIFILLAVGSLIGTWNMSGTIATMTSYGIQILSPTWYYVAVAIVCALIAMGIGSAWTVMGTIGVALIAIATALGVSPELTAGAVVSGSYFGDKMSPLSETTNLAPAVAGTDLYTHIRAMTITTIPSILIALAIYTLLGFREDPEGAFNLDEAVAGIETEYFVGFVPLLPLLLVIFLAIRKTPPTLAILAGALLGGIIAIFWQTEVVLDFARNTAELTTDSSANLSEPWALLKGVWDAMSTGFVSTTGSEGLDSLLTGGGMSSMLTTIWLILAALAFGGIMDYTGSLAKLIEPLKRIAKGDRGIMVATGATAIGINAIAADQYIAIVLTGNVYKSDFEERGIAPQSLSRQIEDTATVTSPLIPWNSCGAYAAGVLGISTVAYAPFAFFNWINPIVSFVYAGLGIGIKHVPPDTEFNPAPKDVEFYGVGGYDGEEVPLDGTEK